AMGWLREWIRRLWGTLRTSRADADLEAELRSHLELAAEAERARVDRPDAAARAAAIRSGGIAQAMEALRDQRGVPTLEGLWRDVRYAARMLRASPGFTAVSVVSLAIGIGANGAVFSFADTLLLRPLAVPDPDAVVGVGVVDRFSDSLVASYP